jgi:hypothetical protein
LPCQILAQQSPPDAPQPQYLAASPAQSVPVAADAPQPPSAQPPDSEADQQKSKREEAEAQIKQEEKQRVLGVLPTFNISYIDNAVSLTAMQKLSLAFRSQIDPASFAVPFLVAGYHEALDEDTGFGWGPSGLVRRSGAAYLDAFDGTIIGNGILPAILHQDPRYFRLGPHRSPSRALLHLH